jgi:hypothetical protein
MSDMAIAARPATLDSAGQGIDAETFAPPLWLAHLKIASLSAAGVLLSSALGVLLFLR